MKAELNPNFVIEAKRVTDSFVCVVIDDFLLNPHELVGYAMQHREDFLMQERAYPGMILPLEIDLVTDIKRLIRSMHERFGRVIGAKQGTSERCGTTNSLVIARMGH